MELVGKPIRKKFDSLGVYKGVVDSFDPEVGYFKVSYEDGDSEELELRELRSMLDETKEEVVSGVSEELEVDSGGSDANQNGYVENNSESGCNSGKNLGKRRRGFEVGNGSPVTPLRRSTRQAANAARAAALSTPDPDESISQTPIRKLDLGSYSNSRKSASRKKCLQPPELGPKVELPPSSMDLNLEGLPALDFFTVYAFLRSLSKPFFVSPFQPETFLAALRCTSVNPLIDSVNFSLLHALKGHLEVLSEEGSPSAAHCIRNLNWELLDLFTWPVFLAEYLLIHGPETKPSIKLPQLSLLSMEYYKQPAEVKLELLRCLCDDVMDVGSIRAEFEHREMKAESEPTEEINRPKKRGSKRKFISSNAEAGSGEDINNEDKNSDECYLCSIDGSLICCDGCPKAFHSKCIGVVKHLLPDGDWYCPECSVTTNEGTAKSSPELSRGGEVVGIDPHGRAYFWSCNYLLVSESYETDSSCRYYSKKDLPCVLKVLQSLHPSYNTISGAISALSGVSTDCCDTEFVDCSALNPSHMEPLSKSMDMEAPSNGEDDQLVAAPGCDSTDALVNERKKRGDVRLNSDVICYTNSYSFGRLASAISVEFMRIFADNKVLKKPSEDLVPLQMKAITNKSPSFCWYTYQKLPLTVQKESCGWCHLCRSSDDDSDYTDCVFKTGLNNTQTKNMGLQYEKSRSHIFSAIQQLLSLEERVRGLLSGPWEDPQYSESWRKAVSNALNVASLAESLLKLESSLRRVALLADWTRPVDSTAVVGSAVHISIRPVNNVSKSIISGRRPGRPSRKSIARIQSNGNSAVGINWWRGGKLSREVFHWKMLPQSLASKAARQGGRKRIPTVVYPDGSDFIARRLKCVAWRATVEMSQTVSQLIFLIKELEFYIKWADISTAEPFSPVIKETKKTAKQFKKVIVRRKELDGTNTKYLLDFGKRNKEKIPPIVVRYGAKHEEPSNERVKYWLGENYVPLSLVRAFEERKFSRQLKKKGGSPSSKSESKPKKRAAPSDKLIEPSSKKRRQSDVLDYLFERAQKMEMKKCSHCNEDVLVSEAVNCQLCEGLFHRKHFRVPKSAPTVVFTCAKCKDDVARTKKDDVTKTKKSSPVKKKSKASPKKKKNKGVNLKKKIEVRRSERLLSMRPQPKKPKKKSKSSKKAGTKPKKEKLKGSVGSVTDLTWPKRKRTISPHSYWLNGLQWTRKPEEELENEFRRTKVIFRAQNLEMEDVSQPSCALCLKDDADHLYIGCAKCGAWFHGDAYRVTPENIHMLIGFKCHKCRKKGAPVCPYKQLPQAELNVDARTSDFLKGLLVSSSIAGTEDGFADVNGLMDVDEVMTSSVEPAEAISGEGQAGMNGQIGSTDDHLNMAQKEIEGFLKVLTGGNSSSKEQYQGTSVGAGGRGDVNSGLFENELLVPVFEMGLSDSRCSEIACLQAAAAVGVGAEDFMHVEQEDGTSLRSEHLNEQVNCEVVNGFSINPSLNHLEKNLNSSYQKMEEEEVVRKLDGLD